MPDAITLVATSFEESLNIPLSLVRNQQWIPSFFLTCQDDSTPDLTGYTFALIVVTLAYDAETMGPFIFTCTAYALLPGAGVQFTVANTDTVKLDPNGLYKWYLEITAPGDSGSMISVAGPLVVYDSPVP